MAALVERAVIAAPHDHFDGERFHNADSGPHTQGSFLKWQFTRERGQWRKWVNAPRGDAPPPRVSEGVLRVTFVNHATMLIQMDGVNILTDPMWSYRCSPAQFAGPRRHRPPGIRFRDLPPIDAVLVSHNHYDHLDIATLLALQHRFRPRIFTPLVNGALMFRHGISDATELDWWDTVEQRPASTVSAGGSSEEAPHRVSVTLVPARHFCARGISDRNRNLWGGFVISGAAGNAYFAGDTGWGDHFARIGAQFGPIRVAMLPIGAYRPRWFMQPVHIDPAEAVEAHKVLHAQTSIPMHYGTFALGDDGELEPLDDLRLALEANGNPAFRILEHGEGFDLP
jgi:L-ascorbate metabolism protein UlaG (beta-lactamase superfamily)